MRTFSSACASLLRERTRLQVLLPGLVLLIGLAGATSGSLADAPAFGRPTSPSENQGRPQGRVDGGDMARSGPRDMVWIPDGILIRKREAAADGAAAISTRGAAALHDTLNIAGFWMDEHEVTVGQYRAFCEKTGRALPPQPGWSLSDRYPVVNVSWKDASDYCVWRGGRLPTESEWEYAALGGLAGESYPWGHVPDHEEANFKGTGGRDVWTGASPVESFPANGFGLYDMAGNAGEWCSIAAPDGPAGPRSLAKHAANGDVLVAARGGSWASPKPEDLAVTASSPFPPDDHSDTVGFRCAEDGTSNSSDGE